MIVESYGVFLTPHYEKYQTQDSDTADVMQATWNFGNRLKARGYKVAYMHGPIGLYESIQLVAQIYEFTTKDHLEEFTQAFDKESNLYFLYQKLRKLVRVGVLKKEEVETLRETTKRITQRKKPVDNPTN